MDVKTLRAKIELMDTFMQVSHVSHEILGIMENPTVSLNEIGAFISGDPVLTARVLKMVNSPVYGFSGRITAVNQGMILLGLKAVRGLLMGITVFDAMQKAMPGLWEHSVGCAVVARIISRIKKVAEPEEVSVSALLHDIGKVMLGLNLSEDYARLVSEAGNKGVHIAEVEKSRLFATHADAGNWVARKWNFPENIREIIEYHHKPHLSRNYPTETAIVHVADIVIRALGFGFAGDAVVPALNPEAWQRLNLSDSNLRDILREAGDALRNAEELSPYE